MNQVERVLRLVKRKGIVRRRDVEGAGLPGNYLGRLVRDGRLQKLRRGLYSLPEPPFDENLSLAEVAKQVPQAVVCLISALRFHGLTTQVPHEIWIALPKGAWRPGSDLPHLNLTFVSGPAYSFGVRTFKTFGGSLKVTTPAKTVADCFKFRAKVGLDVALEALKEAWRARKVTMEELLEAARVCRVARVITPYIEAIV